MSIYDNVKTLCKQRGIGVTTLEGKLGYGRGAIGKWRTAKKIPPADKIQQVADFFDVPYSHILNGTPDFFEETPAKQKGLIPILGQAAAGQPIDAIRDIHGFVQLDAKDYSNGEYYALKVKGDSMFPQINDGDLVIVREQSTVEDGDIAVVLVNGDSATIKKVSFSRNGLKLIPFNTAFNEMAYSAQDVINLPVRIIGKVVEVRRKF